MEAVVLEVRGSYAAVLRKDGIVEKYKGTYEVGQIIEVPDRVKSSVPGWRRGIRAAVAAVILAGMLGTGGYTYQNVLAYSYVSLDIGETSIEYTLNRRDQVIRISSMNDISQETADALREKLNHVEVSEAITQTMDYLESQNPRDYALVAVASGSEQRAEHLRMRAEDVLQHDDLETETETSTPQERRNAEDQGMSMGRWHLHQQFEAEGGPTPPPEEFRNGDLGELYWGRKPKHPPKGSGPQQPGNTGPAADAHSEANPEAEALPANEGNPVIDDTPAADAPPPREVPPQEPAAQNIGADSDAQAAVDAAGAPHEEPQPQADAQPEFCETPGTAQEPGENTDAAQEPADSSG